MTGRRRRPGTWQPAGIEALDVKCFYPKSKIQELGGFVCNPTGLSLRHFKVSILNVMGELNASLHYEGRPSATEKRAALDDLAKPLSRVLATFSGLDQDTRTLLEWVAAEDPHDPRTEPPPDVWEGGFGSLRLNSARRSLEILDRWVRDAAKSQKGRGGRRSQAAIRHAVERLRDVWKWHHRKEPTLTYHNRKKRTIGPFSEFCQAAMAPILEKYKMKTGLERAIRDALYGRNSPAIERQKNPSC